MRKSLPRLAGLAVVSLFLLFPLIAIAGAAPAPQGDTGQQPPPPCALLDDPKVRGLMSAMLETRLLIACGREHELGRGATPGTPPWAPTGPLAVTDVLVNDPSGDAGGVSHTQSETSIRVNSNTGAICAAYNDSYHGVVEGNGYSGFSSSTDGGITFMDHGAVPSGGGQTSYGDPSLVWRRSDGRFYYASLSTSGLGLWRSTDDCETFSFHSLIHSSGGDDKELMAVDNTPTSPYYGRFYVAWTDFGAGDRIYITYSDDSVSWSTPVPVSGVGVDVQGAWPTVAPNGDVYVSWVRWNPYPSGPIDIEVVRSTDGGASFSAVTNPLTSAVNPRDAAATGSCSRPALNGRIRYLPSPQIEVGPDGCLHVVYSYDPDGYGTGDVVNVFYRRSCDSGATWGPEVQLNDDGTTTDQWFPTLSVGPSNVVVATWYDRRLDTTSNYLFDYYKRISYDGGVTWQPSVRVSDVSSPVYIDPELATCYHGDYDQQVQDSVSVYILWSDDRNVQDGHNDPDVWFEREYLIQNPGRLEGRVAHNPPIVGALVTAAGWPTSAFQTHSGADGTYGMTVAPYTYTVTAQAYGFQTWTAGNVQVPGGTTTTLDITMTPASYYVVSGTVTDVSTGSPLWATISIAGDPFDPPTTTLQTDPASGFYSIALAEDVTYTFGVEALLHLPTSTVVAPLTGDRTLGFALTPTTTQGGIVGWVENKSTGDPIEGATVQVLGTGLSDDTDSDGYFEVLGLTPGVYSATASANLFSSVTITHIDVPTSNVTLVTFQLPTAHMTLIPPEGISVTLDQGQQVTRTLTVSNSGEGALEFEIREGAASFQPTLGPTGGGPDPFGYMYRDSTEPDGPFFDWIDATDGTPLNLGDDDEANVVLPFAFDFYGTSSTDIRVGNNGGLLFGVTSGNLGTVNEDLATTTSSNLIVPFWDDIDSETGNVYYKTVGAAPHRVFVVEWHDRPHYKSGGGVGSVTFELLLYEGTNNIKFQYQDVVFGDPDNPDWDYGGSATAGIRETGTNYLQYSHNMPVLSDGLATCYTYPGSPPCDGGDIPWLTQDPLSGTVPGGATLPVELTFDASTVTETGTYQGLLYLFTNDPAAQPYVTYPVTMTVSPAPPTLTIAKVPSMGELEVGLLPLVYTITVSNSGGPATGVVVSDTLPAHTAFAWADTGGALVGDDVVWSGLALPIGGNLSLSCAVTVTCVPSGTAIVNDAYQVHASEWPTATWGLPVTVTAIAQGVIADFSSPISTLLDQPVAFANLSQRATAYEWAFGDGTGSHEVSPVHTYTGQTGDHTVILTASNACTYAVVSHLLTVHDYAVVVDPTAHSGGADPGATVSYTLRVTNTGTLGDVYQIARSGSHWTTQLSTDTLALEPSEGAAVVVRVTVPASAAGGAQDSVQVIVRSLSDPRMPAATANATLTTEANAVYGVDLGLAVALQAGYPGQTVTYTLRVTNTGNIVDTIAFTRPMPGWPTSFSVTSLPIAAGGRRDVQVYVTVPVTAMDGLSDTAVIRATGSGGYAEIQLTTTAVWHKTYLPLVMRD